MQPRQVKVTVLLATFNGARFLEEQLTSLVAQLGIDVEVMVNDDGSTDGTLEILENWRAKGLIVSISHSTGLGSTRAFLKLLQSCDGKDFVAFCDQDDVWEKGKLISQICKLSGQSPQMVFSRRTYINEQNQNIGISPKIKRSVSFKNALIENSAPGNTQLLNRQAIRVINNLCSVNVHHYDSWIYLLINAFGECIYIDLPLVQYRIHSRNSVGLGRDDIFKILRAPDHYYNQALNFRHALTSIGRDTKLDEVEKFLKLLEEPQRIRRLFQCFSPNFYRQKKLDQILMKCLIFIQSPKKSPNHVP